MAAQLLRNTVYVTTNKLVGEPLAGIYWHKLLNSTYREDGWENSPRDYEIWKNSFPKENYTMFYAVIKASKEAVGLASVATYMPYQQATGKPLSAFGMYYVERKFRGHGIGRIMFERAMDECKGHNIFLYGLDDIWEKYAHGKPAFNKLTEWKLRLFSAMPKDIDLSRLHLNSNNNKSASLRVCNWKDVPWNAIVEYDRKLSMGYDREKYLRTAIEQPDTDSFTMVIGTFCPTRNQQIYGLCRIRRCIDNHIVIGPLYADDSDLAKLLLKNSLERLPFKKNASSFKYRAPDCNPDSALLFKILTNGNMSEEILHPQFTDEVVQFPMQFVFSVSEADNALY